MKHLYIAFLSLIILSCGTKETTLSDDLTSNNPNEIVISRSQFENEKMILGELEKRSFERTVKTSGLIDVPPQNKASVSSFVGGFVKSSPLLVGDVVKKGQLLVTLENTEFIEIQQEYLEVSEKLTYFKTEFERQKTLFEENITSQKNYLKAESTYKSALAQYNGLHKKLLMMNLSPNSIIQGHLSSTINIYAPIKGSITKINVSNGSFISISNEILEIVNTDHIHLELSVYEKDILKIKKGQPIKFKVPEATNDLFDADVYLVGTAIEETNRTIKVHGHLHDGEETNFITGMFIEAEIIIETNTGVAILKDATIQKNEDFYGLVLKNENENSLTFEKIKLEIGQQSEEFLEVLNVDMLMNKKVLTEGGYMILNETN